MLFYAFIDEPNKPPLRHSIIIYQKRKRVVGDETIPEKTRILDPDYNGIFKVVDNDPDIDVIKKRMDERKKEYNEGKKHPVLIGPMEDIDEVKKLRYELRPKTAEERVAALEEENERLKALAKRGSKTVASEKTDAKSTTKQEKKNEE